MLGVGPWDRQQLSSDTAALPSLNMLVFPKVSGLSCLAGATERGLIGRKDTKTACGLGVRALVWTPESLLCIDLALFYKAKPQNNKKPTLHWP